MAYPADPTGPGYGGGARPHEGWPGQGSDDAEEGRGKAQAPGVSRG